LFAENHVVAADCKKNPSFHVCRGMEGFSGHHDLAASTVEPRYSFSKDRNSERRAELLRNWLRTPM
jgi:hypothetical protein